MVWHGTAAACVKTRSCGKFLKLNREIIVNAIKLYLLYVPSVMVGGGGQNLAVGGMLYRVYFGAA